MFTGLSNRAHGLRANGIGLSKDVPTLPQLLANAGYRTHSAGKLHLTPWEDPIGVDIEKEPPLECVERMSHWKRGTITKAPDNYYGLETQDLVIGHGWFVYGDYVSWLNDNHPGARDLYGDGSQYTDEGFPWWTLEIPHELHYNTWIADRAIRFVKEQKNSAQPFFLWCSFPDPHFPFTATKKWYDVYRDVEFPVPTAEEINLHGVPESIVAAKGGKQKFKESCSWWKKENIMQLYRQTFGMISHVDEQIGRVLSALEKYGFHENTVIVFMSDHGDQLGEHGLMAKSFYPYDGCTKVPFLAKVPWARNPGKTVHDVVSLYDFAPTILDFACVEQPDPDSNPLCKQRAASLPSPLPGESLVQVLVDGGAPIRKNALVDFDTERTSAFDLIQMRVLVTNEYKLCVYSPTREVILFDRKNDPCEEHNCASESKYAGVVQELLTAMINEINRTESRFPRQMAGS